MHAAAPPSACGHMRRRSMLCKPSAGPPMQHGAATIMACTAATPLCHHTCMHAIKARGRPSHETGRAGQGKKIKMVSPAAAALSPPMRYTPQRAAATASKQTPPQRPPPAAPSATRSAAAAAHSHMALPSRARSRPLHASTPSTLLSTRWCAWGGARLCRLLDGELEADVLARQALVHAGEGVQLVLGGVAVLGVQVHLHAGQGGPERCMLSDACSASMLSTQRLLRMPWPSGRLLSVRGRGLKWLAAHGSRTYCTACVHERCSPPRLAASVLAHCTASPQRLIGSAEPCGCGRPDAQLWAEEQSSACMHVSQGHSGRSRHGCHHAAAPLMPHAASRCIAAAAAHAEAPHRRPPPPHACQSLWPSAPAVDHTDCGALLLRVHASMHAAMHAWMDGARMSLAGPRAAALPPSLSLLTLSTLEPSSLKRRRLPTISVGNTRSSRMLSCTCMHTQPRMRAPSARAQHCLHRCRPPATTCLHSHSRVSMGWVACMHRPWIYQTADVAVARRALLCIWIGC